MRWPRSVLAHAARLLHAHRRVRAGSGAARRGLTVTAQHPVDLLSVQVLLPERELPGLDADALEQVVDQSRQAQ